MRRTVVAAVLVAGCALAAAAQSRSGGSLPSPVAGTPVPAATTGAAPALPEASPGTAKAAPDLAAKEIFSALATPAALTPRAVGFYSRGCLAGAEALPIDGEVWQVMRLSRNRNWGHPQIIKIIERLAEDGAAIDGWPGLLVGDISQPRGGPMPSDHASHQVGLDADIWLTPMPYKRLTYREREDMAFTSMLAPDGVKVAPEIFTPYHAAIIRRAASYPEVERIFVHPAIKKALCAEPAVDRTYFYKIRPMRGHDEHFHVRIECPKDSPGCRGQPEPANDDGCGSTLDTWLDRVRPRPKAQPAEAGVPIVVAKPPRPLALADLPSECRAVVAAGNNRPEDARATVQHGAIRPGSGH